MNRLGDLLPGVQRDIETEAEKVGRKSQFRTPEPLPMCEECKGAGTYLAWDGQKGGDLKQHYCTCPAGQREKKEAAMRWQQVLEDKRTGVHARFRAMLETEQRDYTYETYEAEMVRLYGNRAHPWVEDIKDWLETWDFKHGLIFSGPSGAGKTGLMVVALKQVIEMTLPTIGNINQFLNWQVVWMPAYKLFDRLRASMNGGAEKYDEVLEELRSAPVLAIDDLGKEAGTEWTMRTLFGIINDRVEGGRPTFITTNLSMKELAVRLQDDAFFWRLLANCDVIEVGDKDINLRQKQVEERLRQRQMARAHLKVVKAAE